MRKLVAALRSGKYKQARDWLRVCDSFCCLGVACDISGVGEWVYHKDHRGSLWSYVAGEQSAATWLPRRVALLLADSMGDIPLNGTSAASMNDEGATFAEIADAIEDYYQLREDS